MTKQNMQDFYASQPAGPTPLAKSMGEIRKPVPAPALPAVTEVATEAASESVSGRLPLLNQLYTHPLNRKEFLVAAAGLGVMGFGVKSLLEGKLRQRMPTPFTAHSNAGFGTGKYGG